MLSILAALALFLGPLVALTLPARRRAAAAVLALTAGSLAATAVLEAGAERTLDVTYSFAAYVEQEVKAVDFVVDTASAPGWQWALLAAAWALLWAIWAWRVGDRLAHTLFGPAALAWGGSALVMGLQKLAAPTQLAMGLGIPMVPPFELAVWPGVLACMVLLARHDPKVLPFILYATLCATLAHTPLAVFGTYATKNEWGTALDVHVIDHIANPLTRVSTPLEAKSEEQIAWLVWAPQLIVLPALSMMSAGSIGFATLMARIQARSGS